MLEIAIVLAIVSVTLVFLVRQFVRTARGTDACSGCACASQGCHLGEALGRRTTTGRSDEARNPGGTPGDPYGRHAAAR